MRLGKGTSKSPLSLSSSKSYVTRSRCSLLNGRPVPSTSGGAGAVEVDAIGGGVLVTVTAGVESAGGVSAGGVSAGGVSAGGASAAFDRVARSRNLLGSGIATLG